MFADLVTAADSLPWQCPWSLCLIERNLSNAIHLRALAFIHLFIENAISNYYRGSSDITPWCTVGFSEYIAALSNNWNSIKKKIVCIGRPFGVNGNRSSLHGLRQIKHRTEHPYTHTQQKKTTFVDEAILYLYRLKLVARLVSGLQKYGDGYTRLGGWGGARGSARLGPPCLQSNDRRSLGQLQMPVVLRFIQRIVRPWQPSPRSRFETTVIECAWSWQVITSVVEPISRVKKK